ncbi:hypothetical protein [Streptacidiphilus rugosus]|uniref:hypothetical protein n=1 Tax=Streptacidiphilus rugosus TaxID=405783 RepID=UPI000AE6EA33|nr:hypothetical protein [Streptacidiphilus rugosus]
MNFELQAEYEYRQIYAWHIVPTGTHRSLCGSPLAPAADLPPIADLALTPRTCRTCEILHAGPTRARP